LLGTPDETIEVMVDGRRAHAIDQPGHAPRVARLSSFSRSTVGLRTRSYPSCIAAVTLIALSTTAILFGIRGGCAPLRCDEEMF
jgi:hypothetical protein